MRSCPALAAAAFAAIALQLTCGNEDMPPAVGDDGAGCGVCEREYVSRMGELYPAVARDIREAVCPERAHERPTSNHPLIIGAGQGTTGTRSISTAVYELGFSTLHFRSFGPREDSATPGRVPVKYFVQGGPPDDAYRLEELLDKMDELDGPACNRLALETDWRMYDTVDSVFDSPIPQFWWDIWKTYPNASVILSTRDPGQWAVRRQTFCQAEPNCRGTAPWLHPCLHYISQLTPEGLARAYAISNDFVRCVVPPDRLLEVNVFNNDDSGALWPRLAEFLGKYSYPDKPFPRGGVGQKHQRRPSGPGRAGRFANFRVGVP